MPGLSFDPPDNIPISEFMLNEKYGRHPFAQSRQPFTCGIAGVGYSALEVRDRVEHLAKALTKELAWDPSSGSEWDKVVAVFSLNTVRIGLGLVFEERQMHTADTGLNPDRHTYCIMGSTFRLRDHVSRQCKLHRSRVRASIKVVRIQGFVHLHSASTGCLGSCSQMPNT